MEPLIGGEAIEQSVAARTLQVRLAAAPGTVRGIPRCWIGPSSGSIVMSHKRATLAATRPVATGAVLVRRGAIEVGSGENVVPVWAVTATIYHRPTFGEYGLLG